MPVPGRGGIYTEGMLGQPTYINPLLATQEPDLSLTDLVFSGLYKYDQNGQLSPDLADGMPIISADQKQYTINLKHNAKWHNGKPLTADDVLFTIQTVQDPSFKSPLQGRLAIRHRAKAFRLQVYLPPRTFPDRFYKSSLWAFCPKEFGTG